MPFNTKEIKTDLRQKPAPQHFSDSIDDYEVTKGRNGASFVEIRKTNGEPMELENLLEAFKPQSAYNSSTGAALTVILDTGIYGGRTILEIWVKSSAVAIFTVSCSRDGVNWRVSDTMELTVAGEMLQGYTNAYRYVMVSTTTAANNEIEIVASR